jgi:hypothetical protein
MNIETFVSESLRQIGAGVEAAKKQQGYKISPRPLRAAGGSTEVAGNMVDCSTGTVIVLVEFDLSVVVRAKIEGEASAKLEVFSFDIGSGKIDAGIDHTRAQRIKFHVPVSFPEQTPDT